MKICSKCKVEKPKSDFNRDKSTPDGCQYSCRKCQTDYRNLNQEHLRKINRERNARIRAKDPEAAAAKARLYRENNREVERAQKKLYFAKNKEKIYAYQRKWREENRDKMRVWMREYARDQRANNPEYVIRHRLTNRIRELVKGDYKSASTMELLGCSAEAFKSHLESQFKPGMSWERFMKAEIEIDHIRPCKSFDLTDPAQQRECFHYTNLQPLWMVENRIKGSNDILTKKTPQQVYP